MQKRPIIPLLILLLCLFLVSCNANKDAAPPGSAMVSEAVYDADNSFVGRGVYGDEFFFGQVPPDAVYGEVYRMASPGGPGGSGAPRMAYGDAAFPGGEGEMRAGRPGSPGGALQGPSASEMTLRLISSGIQNGIIADKYGARGTQVDAAGIPTLSLPLMITGFPEKAVAFALVMSDADVEAASGKEWLHWLALFNAPLLPENASITQASTLLQGLNDFAEIGYGGPMPSSGTHTYKFTVYALDSKPNLSNGFSEAELRAAIEGHILAEAVLTGSYAK